MKTILTLLMVLAFATVSSAAVFTPLISVPVSDPSGSIGVYATASAILGGELSYSSDAVTTVQQIKATQGQIYTLYVLNTTAATAYLQVFCKPSASVTLGSTAPTAFYNLGPNTGALAAMTISYPTGLCSGGTGLAIAGTTTSAGSTGAALSITATYQ